MKIIIIMQPISFELTPHLLSSLEQQISRDFDALSQVSYAAPLFPNFV